MYYVGDNKIYRADGSRVMTTSGRQLSINSAGMVLYFSFATRERLVEASDRAGVGELMQQRRTEREAAKSAMRE